MLSSVKFTTLSACLNVGVWTITAITKAKQLDVSLQITPKNTCQLVGKRSVTLWWFKVIGCVHLK